MEATSEQLLDSTTLLESSSDTPALSSDTLASGTSASSSSRGNGEDMLVCGDMGLVVGLKTIRDLSNQEKYSLLKQHFVPSSSYVFPPRIIKGKERRFQHSWLKKFPGLVYSESENGGFCKLVGVQPL